MIETRRLKNIVIFFQKNLNFALSRKIYQLLLIFCALKKICPAYILKHHSNCEKRVILLIGIIKIIGIILQKKLSCNKKIISIIKWNNV